MLFYWVELLEFFILLLYFFCVGYTTSSESVLSSSVFVLKPSFQISVFVRKMNVYTYYYANSVCHLQACELKLENVYTNTKTYVDSKDFVTQTLLVKR